MNWKRFHQALLIGLVLTVAITVSSFAGECNHITQSVLRLHVLANSDSDADQALKLQVRDRVLVEGAALFDQAENIAEAQNALTPELSRIQYAAEDTVRRAGYHYPVRVELCQEYYNTRTYEQVTLPAGQYNSVKVIIGEGKGHNWWCVMFPPMCLPAAEESVQLDAVLSENEIRLVESKPEYEVRFKLVELYERFIQKIRK